MNLCSENHKEIVHEGRNCPVCELIAEHEENAAQLQSKIYELKDALEKLESSIESC